MPIYDDNPQNKVVTELLEDQGNGNQEFTRAYVFDECGDFKTSNDIDIDGNAYTVVGPVRRPVSGGTTILDVSTIETVTTLVDNGNSTLTYTNEDGAQVTFSTSGGTGGGGVTDHGALTGLDDDDHTQYHTDARGDARYYTQAQIDTQQSTQDTNIATNATLIAVNATDITTKYDASNPNGYETPAQLDARDIANRDRTNHTGTQLSSTIADFATAVRSTLLSGLNIVNAAVNAGDTILSSIGKLQGQINHIIINLLYGEFARNEVPLANLTTVESDFLVLNATTPIDGDYRMDWAYSWSSNDAAQDCIVRLYVNGVVMWTQQQEPKDVAGTGITANTTGGGTSNTGTDQRHLVSSFDILPLLEGANTIRITLDSTGANDINTIYKLSLIHI